MMAAAAAAAVASAATISPGLVPPPPGQKVLSVRHYEAGPPLPEEGAETLTKPKDTNGNPVPGSEATSEPLEEEWVTRKRVELTTTRQTETRVKRQVELDEEGRVVGDSGPIVTTSTTEDTHSEEQKHTEHRAVGPDDEPLPPLDGPSAITPSGTKALVVSTEDGSGGVLVREVRERKVKSREEREEICETEDVVHLGDITDEGYLAAVRENKDVRTTAAVDSKAVTPAGPRIVRQSATGRKVVDTEDTEEASLATPDGRLLTETKTQHRHEEENMEEDDDEDGKDLPDETLEGEGKSHKFVRTKEEEVVSYLADGVKVAEEMKYKAEGFEGEKETADETDAPPRLRALKPRIGSRGVQPPSPEGGERKDALTKRPLDLDAEEETRKVETSKWLEHHFGSDSRSSREGSAGGFDDSDPPHHGGVTPGGGSYIGITMKSKTTNGVGRDLVTPTDIREPLRTSPLPPPLKNDLFTNGYATVKTVEPHSSPPPMPTTNGYHHHHTETEIRKTARTSSGSGGQGIIGRKDVIQVLPTGPGRTFKPPRGVAVPPPSTTELTHVEPQKKKKGPPPQPTWTPETNGDEDERVEDRNSRPWSPVENGRRGSGSHGDDLIGRNMSPNFLSGPKPYRPSTISSPSDRSWNNRTEEATVSWANGVTEHHHVVLTNGESHHHSSTNHLAPPRSVSPAPPPQEGVRIARTRRRAPPIPGAEETNGGVHISESSTTPIMSPLEKRQSQQKTRFADEEEEDEDEEVIDVGKEDRSNNKKAKKKVKKKKSGSFGDSIRRLVGRLRSRSTEKKKAKENQGGKQNGHQQQQLSHQKAMTNGNGNARRGSWRSSSRSPSPDEYGEPTYRRYHNAIDGNIRPSSVKRQQEERQREQHRGDLNGRHHGRPVGVRRESSPNEATSEEEELYDEEAVDGVDGREGVGIVVGGPVAPPRSRPATSYQGHPPVTQQHRSLQTESGGSYRHQQHARGHHHISGRGRQQVSSSSSYRRPTTPVNRQSNETSSRGDTDKSWRGSASRGRRYYGPEGTSSGGGSSSRRRNSAYSPERGSAPFSSTNSEGESTRRREAERVPPLLATSTPMDYDKRHSSYTARREDGSNHVQRFYLGEDPFGGSIYGREREYEGVKRSSKQRGHGDEQRRSGVRYGATLGRPTGTSTNHSSSYHSHSEATRAQTLPRKLRHSPPHNTSSSNHVSATSSSVRRQLYADSPATNSINKTRDLQRHTGSLINVSIVNNVTPGTTNNRAPPAKPARTYRSNLSRSKSFNVHGDQGDEVDSALPRHNKLINGHKWESQASRYRSNPQLSRILHEESPLKSPGIISSINRSQKDLRDAVREENNTKFTDMIRKEEGGLLKKKEWSPMNFKERNGHVSSGLSRDVNGGGRSESVRITTVSDGPSVTRTVKNFEKRSSGGGEGVNGGGRLETTYEATTTVTESRTRPTSIWNRGRKSVLGPGFSDAPGGGGVVIEVRNGRM